MKSYSYFTRVAHWDVNNERLHGIWFEEQTGDAHLLDTMFRDVRAHDPNATLFLNDYNVVSTSRMTQVRRKSVPLSMTEHVCKCHRRYVMTKVGTAKLGVLVKCASILGACSSVRAVNSERGTCWRHWYPESSGWVSRYNCHRGTCLGHIHRAISRYSKLACSQHKKTLSDANHCISFCSETSWRHTLIWRSSMDHRTRRAGGRRVRAGRWLRWRHDTVLQWRRHRWYIVVGLLRSASLEAERCAVWRRIFPGQFCKNKSRFIWTSSLIIWSPWSWYTYICIWTSSVSVIDVIIMFRQTPLVGGRSRC